jgi:hypothetical protein
MNIEGLIDKAIENDVEPERFIAEVADNLSAKCRRFVIGALGTTSIALFLAAGAMEPRVTQELMINPDVLKFASVLSYSMSVLQTGFYFYHADNTMLLTDYLGYRRFLPGHHSLDPASH